MTTCMPTGARGGSYGWQRDLQLQSLNSYHPKLLARPQVHEEILRLLLAAAPRLDAAQLGRYLQSALQNSRKSRR